MEKVQSGPYMNVILTRKGGTDRLSQYLCEVCHLLLAHEMAHHSKSVRSIFSIKIVKHEKPYLFCKRQQV